MLIDAVKVLKKRGVIDLDVSYDEEGLKVKILNKAGDEVS